MKTFGTLLVTALNGATWRVEIKGKIVAVRVFELLGRCGAASLT